MSVLRWVQHFFRLDVTPSMLAEQRRRAEAARAKEDAAGQRVEEGLGRLAQAIERSARDVRVR